jgi:hypothetical protein
MTYTVTFLNDNTEGTLAKLGEAHLESRREDFEAFFASEAMETEDLGDFSHYGLSYDRVEDEEDEYDPETLKYFRYQLSWGGPSDEIRFHPNGRIEYVHLDWFCGVGFDVTGDEVFEQLKDWFEGAGMLDEDYKPRS